MPESLLDYSERNPLRDVDWRWRRAGFLLKSGITFSRRRDDAWVRRCYRFRRSLGNARRPSDFSTMADDYPGLYWAHKLHEDREEPTTCMTTHSLEARLMADQDRPSISAKLRLPLEVIEAYHECFFEVGPHLGATDYILFKVLGDAVYRGLRERQYDFLWKLYALFNGPHMLEALISTFVSPSRPGEPAAVNAAIRDNVTGKLGLKAMLSSQLLEVNGFTATQIIEQYNHMVDVERRAGEGGGAQTAIIQSVGDLMNHLPFSAGRNGQANGRTPARVAGRLTYDRSAVELTGDELLRLGAGEEIDVEVAALPPPPSRADTARP